MKRTTFFKLTNPTVTALTGGPLVVDTLNNIQDIITTMFGPGIVVSNLSYTGAPHAIGTFNDTTGNVGIDSGLLMTTGTIYNTVGPNNQSSATNYNFSAGDTSLWNLIGNTWPTFDAAVIEFDFVPQTDTIIACKMIFGSEEYPEFVGSNFNDVFGFFVSGPGFNGLENLAVADTSGVLLSINSINATTNSQYYIDNTSGTTLQYDGYTTVIQFMRPVVNGSSYHFKIAITDVADQAFDSGIFLKSKSFLSYAKMPSAAFLSSPAGGNAVQFSNGTDYAKKYYWDFGDGTIDSSSVNPTHNYTSPGNYTVTLTAVNYYQVNTYTSTISVGGVGIATNEPKPGIQLNQVAPGIYQVSLTHVTTGSMKVYSIDGKLLKEFNALAGSQTLNLDLSACEKGIYILQLNTAQGTISRKIIR
jgi:hypothetical protein